MYTIGVDVGGTKIAYGLFREEQPICRFREPSPSEADGPELCEVILKGMRELLNRTGLSETDIHGMGIGMPSYVNGDTGHVYLTSALVNVTDFAMLEYIQPKTCIPIRIENDSNLAALAEHRYGAGRGSRNMVYMAVSTGIGSGFIINGELFRGSYGGAGETGHMLITPDEGTDCGCRNRGCFISWAGGGNLHLHMKKAIEKHGSVMDINGKLNGLVLKQACDQGDPAALEVLDQIAHYIGVCCFNIYETVNINLFVFGGGYTNFGPMLFDRVEREFHKYYHINLPVTFKMAELDQDFGIIGASLLVRE